LLKLSRPTRISVARNTTRKGISHDLTNTDGKTAATPFTRIPGCLREQISNPQYAQLSFEDRLLLLVDLECNRRLDSRTKRRLKLADFPMQATVEDLDFSPERGLERRLVLELVSMQLGRPGPQYPRLWRHRQQEKVRGLFIGYRLRSAWDIPCVISVRPVFCFPSPAPARRARTSIYCALFPERCVDPG